MFWGNLEGWLKVGSMCKESVKESSGKTGSVETSDGWETRMSRACITVRASCMLGGPESLPYRKEM